MGTGSHHHVGEIEFTTTGTVMSHPRISGLAFPGLGFAIAIVVVVGLQACENYSDGISRDDVDTLVETKQSRLDPPGGHVWAGIVGNLHRGKNR